MSSTEPVGVGRRLALIAATVTFAMLALLAIAAKAHASETVYWDNYDATPPSVSFANIDGSGGGSLGITGATIKEPEGMAYDPVNGRIYVASSGNSQIIWVNVDGSGAGVLNTGTAPVEDPEGVAVDIATQTVYWANNETNGSIAYASANGGSGGVLNTTGATTNDPYKPAIDTANNRIYWVNQTTPEAFSSADLGGSGGSNLALSGAPEVKSVHAINIDPASGRLYWLDQNLEAIGWVNVSGVGGGEIPVASFHEPYGMAFDPTAGRFYWGNYSNKTTRENAIGTVTLGDVVGGITPASAQVEGPQDPQILKSPIGTGVPAITQNVAALSCSQGSWSADYPGSYVYSAPVSYSYQWLLNGQPVAGATASTYAAATAGSYTCSVTGKNPSGSASQISAAATVTAASLTAKLQTKKPKAKAGKSAMVKVMLTNGGDLSSAPVKVCAKLTAKAKKGLKAPKCASVKALAHGGSAVATLKVGTLKTAMGSYKFTTQVKGAAVKALNVTVKVTAAKK